MRSASDQHMSERPSDSRTRPTPGLIDCQDEMRGHRVNSAVAPAVAPAVWICTSKDAGFSRALGRGLGCVPGRGRRGSDPPVCHGRAGGARPIGRGSLSPRPDASLPRTCCRASAAGFDPWRGRDVRPFGDRGVTSLASPSFDGYLIHHCGARGHHAWRLSGCSRARQGSARCAARSAASALTRPRCRPEPALT